jgi:hypothetical protein
LLEDMGPAYSTDLLRGRSLLKRRSNPDLEEKQGRGSRTQDMIIIVGDKYRSNAGSVAQAGGMMCIVGIVVLAFVTHKRRSKYEMIGGSNARRER